MLVSTTILFTTIVSAVAIGVASGYGAIWAILSAFGNRPEREKAVLVTAEATTQR